MNSLPSTQETTQVLASLKRHGYCVLESLIPVDEVDAVRESVVSTVRQHSSLPAPQGYVTGLLRLNQSIAPYLSQPRLNAVMEILFGEYSRISHITGTLNGPGIPRGPVHADWPFNQDAKARVRVPYPDVMMNMVTMWMLTDYTISNGGTFVIPGSHQRHEAPRKNTQFDPSQIFDDEVQLQGKAGDVGLFDARTWHAIAPNMSTQDRVGVIVRYVPWWLNLQPLRPGTRDRYQIVEQHHGTDAKVESVPLDIYEQLPDEVKPLIYHMVEETAL